MNLQPTNCFCRPIVVTDIDYFDVQITEGGIEHQTLIQFYVRFMTLATTLGRYETRTLSSLESPPVTWSFHIKKKRIICENNVKTM